MSRFGFYGVVPGVRLKKEHIQKISELILRGLKDPTLVKFRVSEDKVLNRIIKAISDDMNAEAQVEAEARKLMESYRAQINSGQVDERKIFLMIKKQLAKDKKLILE